MGSGTVSLYSIGTISFITSPTRTYVLPSLSWYEPGTASPIDIEGNVHGSYFESGTGSYEDPFEIARPIQLYYLSWLQEMGYFNERNEAGTGLKQQYHFYLSNDLDMDVTEGGVSFTYNLPPIGTTDYPFVGSFDGKGHYIKNLVITNKETEYSNDPYHHKDGDPTGNAYEILGMFGVLGSTDGTNTVNSSKQVEGSLVPNDNQVTFDQSKNYVKNFYLDTVTINATTTTTDRDGALVGVVAGYANAPISGVGIKGATLTIGDNRTPINDLAGTTDNTALSKYTSIGFATDGNHRNIKFIDEDIYAPKATQSSLSNSETGDAWGGSIEFESLLERIHKSRNLSGAQTNRIPQYVNGETIVKDVDGTVLSTITTSTSTSAITNGGNKTTYYKQDNDIGAYYFKEMTASGDKKVYLEGMSDIDAGNGTTSTYKAQHIIQKTNSQVTAYYIQDDNGYYIGVNSSGALARFSTAAEAVKWHFNETNHDLFSLQYDGTTYSYLHLNCSPTGVFSIGTTSQTNWTLINGRFRYSAGSEEDSEHYWENPVTVNGPTNGKSSYTLYTCSCGAKKLEIQGLNNYTNISGSLKSADQTNGFIKLNNNGGYVDYNFTYSGETTTAVMYFYSVMDSYSNNGNYTMYTGSGGGTRTSPNFTLSINNTQIDLSSKKNITFNEMYGSGTQTIGNTGNSSNYAEVEIGSFTLRNGANSFRYTRNDSYNLLVKSFDIVVGGVHPTEEDKFADTTSTSDYGYTESDQQVRAGQAGYIPLTVTGAASKFLGNATPTLDDYKVKSTNTGYVVGGFYDRTNGGAGFDTTYTGDVRFSAYAISNISSSFNTSTDKISAIQTYGNVDLTGDNPAATQHTIASSEYTVGGSGTKSFKKLADSISKLEDTLKDKSYVYGIHFMDSTISQDHIITAPKAVVNGVTYTDYELPEDSIDFSLKEKGYINFFAGDYQNNNNSFFSLHEITRDASGKKITSIRELKYVYAPADGSTSRDYIYQYKDGGYSTTGVTASGNTISKSFNGTPVTYKRVFDTAWIGVNGAVKPLQKNLWYFEIPVNKGEFALGSVEGGCGGYLVYLDISAAAQTVERKEVTEYYEKETLTADIANGVQYVDSIPTPVAYSGTKYKREQVPNTNDNPQYTYTVDNTNGTYYLDPSDNQYKKISQYNVRNDVANIDDMDSFVGTIGPDSSSHYASAEYEISRSGSNISVDPTTNLTTGYIGNGLTLNNGTVNQTVKTIVRKITDYDFNTMTNIYVKQVTVVETTGTTNVAHTTIYNCSKNFASDTTEVATFSYSWEGASPTFAYKYTLSLNTFAESNNLEVNFETSDSNGIKVTLDKIDSNFTFSVKGFTPTSTVGTEFTVAATELDYTPMKWYDFTKQKGGYTTGETTVTPTKLVTFHYMIEGNEQIEEDFQFVGYDKLGSLSDSGITPSNTPQTISISDAVYQYYFTLTGKDPNKVEDVYVWYVSSGTITVSTGTGSDPIHFYKTTDGNWVPQA